MSRIWSKNHATAFCSQPNRDNNLRFPQSLSLQRFSPVYLLVPNGAVARTTHSPSYKSLSDQCPCGHSGRSFATGEVLSGHHSKSTANESAESARMLQWTTERPTELAQPLICAGLAMPALKRVLTNAIALILLLSKQDSRAQTPLFL